MATEAGIKHDHGKPRASLVVHGFARALLEVSAVATFGAEKYSANGWVSVPSSDSAPDTCFLSHTSVLPLLC